MKELWENIQVTEARQINQFLFLNPWAVVTWPGPTVLKINTNLFKGTWGVKFKNRGRWRSQFLWERIENWKLRKLTGKQIETITIENISGGFRNQKGRETDLAFLQWTPKHLKRLSVKDAGLIYNKFSFNIISLYRSILTLLSKLRLIPYLPYWCNQYLII